MYSLFNSIRLHGTEGLEGNAGLILLIIAPFFLAIIAGVASGALARNVGRLSKQPNAPQGAAKARTILWLATFFWILLFVVFPASMTISSGEGDDFPIGMLTVLPVYLGFCVAIYTTGAAYSAWIEENKLESMLIIGLAWAAFGMFLILPAVISSWEVGEGNLNVSWESALWWLRFGNLFPAIAPWMIVVGLYFIHNRSIALIEDTLREDVRPPPIGVNGGVTKGDPCPQCGGSLSIHPKTGELFCTACGWGLMPEAADPLIVDVEPAPTSPIDQFVEQPQPSSQAPPPVPTPRPSDACTICGGTLAVLTQTQQIYCTGCGTGLPASKPQQQPAVEQTAQTTVEQQAPPPTPPAPPPAPAPAPAPAPPPTPTQAPSPAPAAPPPAPAPAPSTIPSKCPICGAMTTTHPRTGERFCPACGAGLRSE
jgi:uncharacterized Zn finger protein (UPF0148 family)